MREANVLATRFIEISLGEQIGDAQALLTVVTGKFSVVICELRSLLARSASRLPTSTAKGCSCFGMRDQTVFAFAHRLGAPRPPKSDRGGPKS